MMESQSLGANFPLIILFYSFLKNKIKGKLYSRLTLFSGLILSWNPSLSYGHTNWDSNVPIEKDSTDGCPEKVGPDGPQRDGRRSSTDSFLSFVVDPQGCIFDAHNKEEKKRSEDLTNRLFHQENCCHHEPTMVEVLQDPSSDGHRYRLVDWQLKFSWSCLLDPHLSFPYELRSSLLFYKSSS